jgi:hypothetical protein
MKRDALGKLAIAVGCVVGGALLVPAGQAVAAGQVPQVFVANDAAHPVPVSGNVNVSAGTTAVLWSGNVCSPPGSPAIDVSRVRDVSVAVAWAGAGDMAVQVLTTGADSSGLTVDEFVVPSGGSAFRHYEVPGREIRVRCDQAGLWSRRPTSEATRWPERTEPSM